MQKVTQFLEKNVEWVAVGAGALFLLWMVYLYLLMPPVSKKVGDTVLTPDNVEQWIASGPASTLANLMSGSKVPAFVVDDFTSAVTNGLQLDSLHPTELASGWDFHPFQLSNLPGSPLMNSKETVTQLPVIPTAKPLLISSGQSTVTQNANAANPGRVDLDWITGAFVIPAAPLLQQWTACFGPSKAGAEWKLLPTQLNTEFLTVTAWRSEKLPNGNWSDEEQVKPLFNIQLWPYPAAGNRNAEAQYVNYAARQMTDISTPAFPQIAAAPFGTTWKDPLTILHDKLNPGAPATPAGPQQPGDQSRFFPMPTDSGAFITVAGPTYGAGPMPGPPPNFLRQQQQRAPQAPPPPPVEQAPPPTQTVVAQSTDPTVAFTLDKLPTVTPVELSSPFNPGSFAKDSPDILIFFNDGTAQPGKTYRYRVQYSLLNPVYNRPKEHVPKEHEAWVSQLALASGQSDYTPEMTVPQKTYFFCDRGIAPAGRAGFPFEVFTWADGLWRKQTFNALPGDLIGGVNNNYDYSTGYTYVDGVRRNGHFVVTLVDDSGIAEIRDAARDTNSPDHKKETQLVDQQTAAPTAENGVTPPPVAPPPSNAGVGGGRDDRPADQR